MKNYFIKCEETSSAKKRVTIACQCSSALNVPLLIHVFCQPPSCLDGCSFFWPSWNGVSHPKVVQAGFAVGLRGQCKRQKEIVSGPNKNGIIHFTPEDICHCVNKLKWVKRVVYGSQSY